MLLTTAESSQYSVAEVAARFQVDPRIGLKWTEANSRSKIVGYNEMPAVEEDPTWKKYIEQFKNPLILLLLGKFVHQRFCTFSQFVEEEKRNLECLL